MDLKYRIADLVDSVLPMDLDEGPPLPSAFRIIWPGRLGDVISGLPLIGKIAEVQSKVEDKVDRFIRGL